MVSPYQSNVPAKPVNIRDWNADPIQYKTDPFWMETPDILWRNARLIDIVPTPGMSFYEQLNAITRLGIYVGMVFTVWYQSSLYLYIIVGTLLFTWSLYVGHGRTSSSEGQVDPKKPQKELEYLTDYVVQGNTSYPVEYVEPTINNPFMNVLPFDQVIRPNREAVSKLNVSLTPALHNSMNQAFGYNLYKDVEDVFDRRNSQRQFYTMPVTTIPNEQGKFADWLYKTNPTCKEQNGFQCMRNLGDGRVRPGRL